MFKSLPRQTVITRTQMNIKQLKYDIANDPNSYIGGFDWCAYRGGWRSRCHLDGTPDSRNQWVSYIYPDKISAIDVARGESIGLLDLYCNVNGLNVEDVLSKYPLTDTVRVVGASSAPRTAPTPQPQQRYYQDQDQARRECKQNLSVITPLHTWIIDLCSQADKAITQAMTKPRHYTERAKQALHKYVVGGYVNLYQQQYTCFWYVDNQRTIQAKKQVIYNLNGKRDRDNPYSIIMHNSPSCFFGEHLTKGNTTPVVIVESEKTAVLCSSLIDSVIWLATGGSSNLTKLLSRDCLKGRTVYVCADCDKVNEWRDIITKHREQTHSSIFLLNDMRLQNELLNLNGKEDIADKAVDYLIRVSEQKPSKIVQHLTANNPSILGLSSELGCYITEVNQHQKTTQ